MPEPTPDGHALLRFDAVACARGGRVLWRGVSFTLDAGACLVISGSNGCGKSSLLRVAAGLLPAASGTVTHGGMAGLIDEAPALDRTVSLNRALGFWSRLNGAAPATVAEATRAVGLDALGDVPVRILSTGQRKRAALARLLIEARPLWLLDEPANGLDTEGLDRLVALIADHRATGGAVLIASHQALPLPDARALALRDFAP